MITRFVWFFTFVYSVATAQYTFNDSALVSNLKYLASDELAGRYPQSAGSALARTFIEKQFTKFGVRPLAKGYALPFEFKKSGNVVKGINLAGLIKGKADVKSYLVVSAHYDHVGLQNGEVYNGADDNASGTCALFALAEFLQQHPPQHNIILVAFDAEEQGLRGARAFVENPPVPLNLIVANINMDMVARADNNALVAVGTFYYPQLKPLLENVAPVNNVKLVFGHDDPAIYKGSNNWTNSSDHGPFHKASIPFVYFGVEDHQDYHKPTDDFDKVNSATYKACVQLIINSLVSIDQGLK